MHQLVFYPLGNADSYLARLNGGELLLFDYANMRDPADKTDLRIDLPKELRAELGNRDFFDVVGFTHADDDHVRGASQFFHLDHAKKYQGEDRIKIKQFWVPAALIIENGLEGDARILQAEARYRLKAGSGIRVFSRPDALKEWLEDEGLRLEDRRHLITDAGQVVPGFSKDNQGVEFFVHSPFAKLVDGVTLDRNECSLIFHVTFLSDGVETRWILAGDTACDLLAEIVEITELRKNHKRLDWDIFKLPHHCSYLSLSNEKGKETTEPLPAVKRLFDRGSDGAIIVATCESIPAEDSDQPPHKQAANYYKGLTEDRDGQFSVTMEHPSKKNPQPLKIKIDKSKATVEKRISAPGLILGSQTPPRAG